MSETALGVLQRQYESATTGHARVISGARFGIGLAQIGRVDEARLLGSELRVANEVTGSDLGSIYLLALDGFVLYYSSGSKQSLDRIHRAYLLANASNSPKIAAEVGNWLSLLAYNFDKVDLLDESIASAMAGYSELTSADRARLLGRVGDLLQLVGEDEVSLAWYQAGRVQARAARDGAVISSIEYNRLAAGISRLRQDEILGYDTSWAIQRAWDTEVQSVRALHAGYQNAALPDLIALCDARQAHLRGDNAASAAALMPLVTRGSAESVGATETALRLEAAWYCCLASSGDADIESLMAPILPSIDPLGAHDVDVVFYLSAISERINIVFSSGDVQATLDRGRAQLREYRNDIFSLIQQYKSVDPVLLDSVR